MLCASPLSDIALRTSVETGIAYASTLALVTVAHRLSPWHPLASYPGPLMARATSLWLSHVSSTGKRYLILDALHARYGPFLRIGKLFQLHYMRGSLIPTVCRARYSVHQLSRGSFSLSQCREGKDVSIPGTPCRHVLVLQAT